MPMLQIYTNLPHKSIPNDFLLNLNDLVSNLLNKPLHLCSVHILPDQIMSFGGSCEPCAFVSFISINNFGQDQTKEKSKLFMEEFEKIGLSANRVFIYFQDVQPYQVGYNKETLAEIIK